MINFIIINLDNCDVQPNIINIYLNYNLKTYNCGILIM